MPNAGEKIFQCQSWLSELEKHHQTKANQQVIPSKDLCNTELFFRAVHKAFSHHSEFFEVDQSG